MEDNRSSQFREKGSEFKEQAREAGQQVAGKASQLKEKAADMSKEAMAATKETMGKIKESATDLYQESRRKVTDFWENVESYIQEQPVKSVLIASGIGMVLGLIWKRSRSAD